MKEKIKRVKEKIKNLFGEAQWEGIKKVARFLVFYVVSGAIAQMLNQLARVPDFWFINIWVFSFSIAIRSSFKMALTLLLSYIDTKNYKAWKIKHPRSEKNGGLIKW